MPRRTKPAASCALHWVVRLAGSNADTSSKVLDELGLISGSAGAGTEGDAAVLTDQQVPVAPIQRLVSGSLRQAQRATLAFRAINQRDAPDYDPGLQRHHILPRQLLSQRCFGALFETIGRERVGFDDFRSNGLLQPACDAAAVRLGLPLHRGPHRSYNAMVIERVGQVEASWSSLRLRAPEFAQDEALLRLGLLQRALRRRLLSRAGKPLALNRFDPQGRPVDFSELDAMAEALWGDSGAP